MKPKIALQLWSIKEACEANFHEALKEVKKSGFDGVEFAGYYGKSAAEVKGYLDECGLEAAASHIAYEKLRANLEETVAFEKAIGNKRIVVPHASFATFEEWQAFIAEMEEIAAKVAEDGMEFYYHNHAHEFTEIPGQDIIDYIYKHAKHIRLEMDLYWLSYSGTDVFPWLAAHQDRIGLLHMKDMQESPQESTEIGSGILPMKKYVELAKQLALPWLIVEQEAFQKYQPLEATSIGYRQLKALVEEVYA